MTKGQNNRRPFYGSKEDLEKRGKVKQQLHLDKKAAKELNKIRKSLGGDVSDDTDWSDETLRQFLTVLLEKLSIHPQATEIVKVIFK
jgi:hypothetical protein